MIKANSLILIMASSSLIGCTTQITTKQISSNLNSEVIQGKVSDESNAKSETFHINDSQIVNVQHKLKVFSFTVRSGDYQLYSQNEEGSYYRADQNISLSTARNVYGGLFVPKGTSHATAIFWSWTPDNSSIYQANLSKPIYGFKSTNTSPSSEVATPSSTSNEATKSPSPNEKKQSIPPSVKIDLNPDNFSKPNISEFTRHYAAESKVFLKKGEFETTQEYKARLEKGFKIKSLDTSKIYAFQLNSIKIKYNPDNELYEVTTAESSTSGRLFDNMVIHSRFAENQSENTLRIGTINRTTSQYKGSNAYGKTANVIRLRGTDFYIKSSISFSNTHNDALLFSTNIETAKKNASCNKQVYVFAKLNGKTYADSSYDYAAIETPKIDSPVDIQIKKQTIPMDIIGMVLRCSNGKILSTQIPSEHDEATSSDKYDRFYHRKKIVQRNGVFTEE